MVKTPIVLDISETMESKEIIRALRAAGVVPNGKIDLMVPVRPLVQVIDYLWHDEGRHFLECSPGDRRGHIFLSVLALAAHTNDEVNPDPETKSILRRWMRRRRAAPAKKTAKKKATT